MQRKQGFTLIELLVVIAIIAILAAILFPVFARAREKARASNCLSNVKQMALGVMQYVQDYDSKYPSVYDDTQGYRIIWAEKISIYVKNNQIFACPSSDADQAISKDYPSWGLPPLQGTRYAMDMCGDLSHSAWGVFTEGPYNAVIESSMEYPSQSAMIVENRANWWQHYHPQWNPGLNFDDPKGRVIVGQLGTLANQMEWTYPWHQEGINAAYCDGHAKFQTTRKIENNLRFWSRGGQPDGS